MEKLDWSDRAYRVMDIVSVSFWTMVKNEHYHGGCGSVIMQSMTSARAYILTNKHVLEKYIYTEGNPLSICLSE